MCPKKPLPPPSEKAAGLWVLAGARPNGCRTKRREHASSTESGQALLSTPGTPELSQCLSYTEATACGACDWEQATSPPTPPPPSSSCARLPCHSRGRWALLRPCQLPGLTQTLLRCLLSHERHQGMAPGQSKMIIRRSPIHTNNLGDESVKYQVNEERKETPRCLGCAMLFPSAFNRQLHGATFFVSRFLSSPEGTFISGAPLLFPSFGPQLLNTSR